MEFVQRKKGGGSWLFGVKIDRGWQTTQLWWIDYIEQFFQDPVFLSNQHFMESRSFFWGSIVMNVRSPFLFGETGVRSLCQVHARCFMMSNFCFCSGHVCLVGLSHFMLRAELCEFFKYVCFWRSVISMWVLEDKRSDRSFVLAPKKVIKWLIFLGEFYWILMLWPSRLVKRCLKQQDIEPVRGHLPWN